MPLAITVIGVLTLWGALALWYRISTRTALRILAVGAWGITAAAMLLLLQEHRSVGIAGYSIAFLSLLTWWLRLKPSNERPWAADVARMTHGMVTGQEVVLHDVRNFEWRTRTDFTPRWETRTYDLNQLETVDLIISYWSYTAIAHVLVSFGFPQDEHVVFSVEIRRDKTASYSEIGGFFREFELSIIAADERDIIRVRTNVRREDDYLYRLALPPAARRALLLAYLAEANRLTAAPRFYNTLTANCTTLIYHMMSQIVGHLPLDYRLLLSGYLPGYVYKVGGLDKRYSLPELRVLGRITERARNADQGANFSAAIRAGIPALPEAG